MQRFLLLLLTLTLAGVAGCLDAADDRDARDPAAQHADLQGGMVAWTYEEPVEPEAAPEPIEPVRFLIIGDQGAGNEGQYRVGQTMKTVCAAQGCDFVMTTGDNIYDFGSYLGADDPQFEEKFELPYADLEMPFYLSLGNHDNFFGGFSQHVGQAQVDYHYKEGRMSDKWHMPGRYYQQAFGEHLEIFAIDTDGVYKDDAMVELTPEQHQAWLRDTLDASNATWKIAFGHYNYVSNGNYGDGNADFKAAIENSICDRAHFYAWGHDHDLQWVKPVDTCGRTEFLGSSAASKARSLDPEFEFDARFGAGDVLGFAWIEVVGETLTAQFWDVDENLLFEESVTKSQLGWTA